MASATSAVFWSNGEYEIRPAKSTDEVREVWWGFMQRLGWNRGYYDLDTYIKPSLGCGMILLIENSSGKPVGHIAAVINTNSTGWVAMFIVDEKHRGKGLGGRLFEAAQADFLRNGTNITGLDGVAQQKQSYERRNFVSSPLGSLKTMVRSLDAEDPLPDEKGGRIVDIRSVAKELLVQHELKYTGFERPRLWSDEHMFNRKDVCGVALVTTDKPKDVGDLLAWAVLRRSSHGFRFGPLYAGDTASARKVMHASIKLATPSLIRSIPLPNEPMNEWPENKIAVEATLEVEIWDGNPDALRLFEELGWNANGEVIYHMWADGRAPSEQMEGGAAQKGVYAVFDGAIG